MRITNNTAAFNTWTNYTKNLNDMQSSMKRLSTSAISSTDNPVGIGIGERMRSQLGGITNAVQSTENSISLRQQGDTGSKKINDSVFGMKSLTLETQGEGVNTDKENVQAEFKQLQDEITRITSRYAAAANFNGLNLFKGETGAETTNGNTPNDASSDVIETDNTNTSPVDATGQTEAAINYISNARENLGAQQARTANTRETLMTYEDNLQAAETKVRDIDLTRESNAIAKYQTLSNVSNAMLSQANQLTGSMLRLIG